MDENLKSDVGFYKPVKSVPAFVNTQSANQTEPAPHEDSANRAKRTLDGIDARYPSKSARWSSQLSRSLGDDLAQLSRFEGELSMCQLSGRQEGLSHGCLCRCLENTDPVKKFQDFAGKNWSAADKNLSFMYHNEDCRNFSEDWNPVVPFPHVKLESARDPFSDNSSILRNTVFENDQMHRSYDTSLSVILMKLQTQSKVIEKLHNGLRRLEDERNAYIQLFRELRDEIISLNGQMAESQTGAGFPHDLGVWKHQIATEVRQLKADFYRFQNRDKNVVVENSSQMVDLMKYELSETKKFLSDEAQAERREIRKLLSRTGQLEVDMMGVMSENKDLHKRLQKLDKTMHDVVQSQTFLSRDLYRTQNLQITDRTDLEEIQRNYGCILQKLNLLTLDSNGRSRGVLKDVPTISLRTADLQQKTDRKNQVTRMKAKQHGHVDLSLDMTSSESSSVTSLTDTALTNYMLAKKKQGKELGVSFTSKKAKGKKNTKRIDGVGFGPPRDDISDTYSQLPDIDIPDSLADPEERPTNLEGSERHPREGHKLLSAANAESVSYSATTKTTSTTTTSSSSSCSLSSSSSSSSSSSCASSEDLTASSRSCEDDKN